MGLKCCGHEHADGTPEAAWINPCLCGAPKTQAAFDRIEADISRRQALGGTAAVLGMFAGFGLA
ncbi:MAG: hydrolase, partial [Alphaproteobacteria bacterium HGW-Alphaproteobacteria-14]